MKETVIKDFLFTDDCALNAISEQAIEASTDRLSGACDNFSLTISNNKTEVMYQLCPGKPHVKPDITVNGEVLNNVDKFTYLRNTLSRQADIDDEVKCRISKASSAFGRLQPISGSKGASASAPSSRSTRL